MSIDLSEQTLLLQIWIASLVLWGYINHSNIATLVSIVSVFGFECWKEICLPDIGTKIEEV